MTEKMAIPESWTFKCTDVANNFDSHVREQLPWYDILSDLVCTIAIHYLPEGAKAYDIGASTGNLARRLADTISRRKIDWVAIDNSEAMGEVYNAPGSLAITDAIKYDYKPFNLAICFLSMMFFPVEERRTWLKNLISKMKPGSAIIIVDKMESDGGTVSAAVYRSLLAQKRKNGASCEDILKKEESLGGIQRPLGRDFFNHLGAKEFFRFGDFFGVVIEAAEW